MKTNKKVEQEMRDRNHCPYCKEKFIWKASLIRHIRKEHKGDSYNFKVVKQD